MIETLRVQLVTPAMIGGATAGTCDSTRALRVPELRGLFRFWTRALGGDAFRELEERLWGSTTLGQRVTLRSIPTGDRVLEEHFLFPAKEAGARTRMSMMAPGVQFDLRFGLPRLREHERLLRQQLQAVVWTALHLGAVGRRSRRGYGSLQWVPGERDLLWDFLDGGFVPDRHLGSQASLKEYLQRGLTRVCSILGRPAAVAPAESRQSSSWFQLTTIDQVFVGRRLTARYDGQRGGMEDLIHGCGERGASAAESAQLGSPEPRLASPMSWRIYRLKNDDYVPVMTWSPRDGVTALTANTNMHKYLTQRLGFGKSLANLDL